MLISGPCLVAILTWLVPLTVSSGLTVELGTEECDLEISYLDIQLICHTADRPAFSIGRGEFLAEEHTGSYEINDTVFKKVDLVEFSIDLPVIHLSNEEVGVGIDLSITEDVTEGIFEFKFSFPDKYYPAIQNYNRFWVNLVGEADESIFGAGEQLTYLNLKGKLFPIWVQEGGIGRNKSTLLTQLADLVHSGGDFHTTYWPQPSYLSSRKYYIQSTFQAYHELDFSSEDRNTIYWHYTVPGQGEEGCTSCHISILIKPTLMEIVQKLNPGQPELPDWVYNGAILGVQGGTDKMLGYLDDARKNGIQVAGMWIQDWSGKIETLIGKRVFWNWKWNSEWYPNLDTVIKDLDEDGIKVTAYVTAHLNVEGDLYKSFANEPFWINDNATGGQLLQDFGQFTVATADIIRPDPECNCVNEGREFYKDMIRTNMIDFGFAGWMADFGEYITQSARSKYPGSWWGEDHGEVLHQMFSQEWAALNREVVEEVGKLGEVMYWMRSGGVGSKMDQVMSWAGDQTVDWTKSDGLPSSIVAALSLATSGMGLSHSDIGGYTGTPKAYGLGIFRTKELLLRWAEYSAFTPIMRTHEGNEPEANHQFYSDVDTMQQFGRLTNIYTNLKPYMKATVYQNTKQHIPVMRPLFLMFDNDTEAFKQEYEYMLGDDLLVAPVLTPDTDSWTVYLPGPETWTCLWDNNSFEGFSFVEVSAPLGKTPVFYRQNSQWQALFSFIGEMNNF